MIDELTSGLSALYTANQLLADPIENVVSRLKNLSTCMFNGNRMKVMVTAEPRMEASVMGAVEKFLASVPASTSFQDQIQAPVSPALPSHAPHHFC